MKKLHTLLATIFTLAVGHSSYAQDVRASDYQAIPLVVNPAQAGNFEGVLRATAYKAAISGKTVKNNYTNLSVDVNVGMYREWAFGMNFFSSGHKDFQVSNKVLSLSLARKFYLDSYDVSTIRVGAQVSYNQSDLDENKAVYDLDADVGVMRIPTAANRPVGLPPQVGQKKYLNFGVGGVYVYQQGDVRFETGIAFFNLTQPKNSLFNAQAGRRLRGTVQNSFNYTISDQVTLNLNYLIWQERLFLVGYNPADVDENSPIKEDIFGFGADIFLYNNKLSFEIAERSFKSVIGNVGFQFKNNFRINVAYEQPVNANYYDLKHLQFGLKLFLGE